MDREFEIYDSDAFHESRYFDVFAEYAKASEDDILIKITVANRGPESAPLALLPTIWFRNTWCWGRTGEGYWPLPAISANGPTSMQLDHESLGRYSFLAERETELLFTGNETNSARLFGYRDPARYVKDAFDDYVLRGRKDAVNPAHEGTKAAALYHLNLAPGQVVTLKFRLASGDLAPEKAFDDSFEQIFAQRIQEADTFYAGWEAESTSDPERQVIRQAYAGLLWSKQFYYYAVRDWLEGDPAQPSPPAARWQGRNHEWLHLFNRDLVSMPDKWEYPWYAAWDLGFHMIPFAQIDPEFAKQQLVLFHREWYMNPNGQVPAYEFAFSDVNPPVLPWAAWRVYKISAPHGQRDRAFLARIFHKCLINFTWWVNRKDVAGKQLFSGGFLGLDNIGVFDRSQPLPNGQALEQADGTAWMTFLLFHHARHGA